MARNGEDVAKVVRTSSDVVAVNVRCRSPYRREEQVHLDAISLSSLHSVDVVVLTKSENFYDKWPFEAIDEDGGQVNRRTACLGNTVTRNAREGDPAVKISRDGNDVVKLAHELNEVKD
ncbi:hypothetical protein NUW54_g12350 [Trametes sanguinea]|uniref:Uncharacterized protein n=1 Tax=Trametes sanguinea TaxID=158606 RepID=A0ACC1MZ08_9APHY|nr:hypothetical protein NUW54_g12350 [Trametes sanguinea]